MLSAHLRGHTTCSQLFIYARHNCDSDINFITFLIHINAISIVSRETTSSFMILLRFHTNILM